MSTGNSEWVASSGRNWHGQGTFVRILIYFKAVLSELFTKSNYKTERIYLHLIKEKKHCKLVERFYSILNKVIKEERNKGRSVHPSGQFPIVGSYVILSEVAACDNDRTFLFFENNPRHLQVYQNCASVFSVFSYCSSTFFFNFFVED